MDNVSNILLFFIPILIIDFGFKIYSILDIIGEDRKVKGGNKIIWLLFIVLVYFAWVFYLLFGRENSAKLED